MHRPSTRRASSRALTAALLVLVLATLLSAVTSIGAQAVGERVQVSRSVTAGTVLAGDGTRVSGRVSAPPGTAVVLQRQVAGRWVGVRAARLDGNRAYRFDIATRTEGSSRYRVYAPTAGSRPARASAAFAVRVLPCKAMARPPAGAATSFTRPGLRYSPLARQLSELVCSAARGSTIQLSMYFMNAVLDGSDVGRVTTSLQRVARYRGVKVRFVFEGKLYNRGKPLYGAGQLLRKFGKVTLCQYGCHNERPLVTSYPAIMHHKFVTVSDTRWLAGQDPAVLITTGNLTRTQQRNFWQSAVLLHNDRTLFERFDVQFERMVTCGAFGCSAWRSRLQQLGLPADTYGLTNNDGLWTDTHGMELAGNRSGGRSVVFSPFQPADPLAQALQGYRCTPEHRTVRVAHMFVTSGRQPVIDALRDLRARGCRVEVVLRQLIGSSPLKDGAGLLRDAGLAPRCLPRLHNKVILLDAVRISDGLPDRVLWTGSQSLGVRALRSNEESLLRLSTRDATGPAARNANSRVWSAFDADFLRMRSNQVGCI